MTSTVENNQKKDSLFFSNLSALLFFFIIGFSFHIYWLCWLRKATLLWGDNPTLNNLFTIILFSGLALGSYFIEKYLLHFGHPLRIIVLLTIITGCLSIVNVFLFEAIIKWNSLIYPMVIIFKPLELLVKVILLAFLVFSFTTFAGGAFPLFTQYFIQEKKYNPKTLGLLFSLFAIGGAMGCIIGGFLCIPGIGINLTVTLTSSLIIGLGGFFLLKLNSFEILKKNKAKQKKEPEEKTLITKLNGTGYEAIIPDYITVYSFFFLTGFTLVGAKILWTRFLSLIVQNNIYTSTALTSIVLTGIVVGIIIISLFIENIRYHSLVLGTIHLLIGSYILGILSLPIAIWSGMMDTDNTSTQIFLCLIIALIPAVLYGFSLPLAFKLVLFKTAHTSSRIVRLITLITCGCIISIISVYYIILPLLGLHRALLIISGCSIGGGFCAIILLERQLKFYIRSVVTIIGFIAWGGLLFSAQTRLPEDFFNKDHEIIDIKETSAMNLTVSKSDSNLVFMADRVRIGIDKANHEIITPHILALLHKKPKEVLILGMGLGHTAKNFLLYDIHRLDCLLKERHILTMLKKHTDATWLDDPRLKLIFDDSRSYIYASNKKYDLISIETSRIFRSQSAAFYSVDFYEKCKDNLKKHGLISQLINPLNFDLNQFRSLVKSFLTVFPHSILWYNGPNLMLIGSVNETIIMSQKRLDLIKTDSTINKNLHYSYWGGPRHWLNHIDIFLAGFLCADQSLLSIGGNHPVFRDDLPILEYKLAKNRENELNIEIFKKYLDPINQIFREQINILTEDYINYVRILNLNDMVAQELIRYYDRFQDIGYLNQAFTLNPKNFIANYKLGVDWQEYGNIELALQYFTQTISIDPECSKVHNMLAMLYHKISNFKEALYHYSEALRINPNYYQAHNNLGILLISQGSLREAIPHFKKALKIKPDFKQANSNLKNTQQKLKLRIE